MTKPKCEVVVVGIDQPGARASSPGQSERGSESDWEAYRKSRAVWEISARSSDQDEDGFVCTFTTCKDSGLVQLDADFFAGPTVTAASLRHLPSGAPSNAVMVECEGRTFQVSSM